MPQPAQKDSAPAHEHTNGHAVRMSWARLLKRVFHIDAELQASLNVLATRQVTPIFPVILLAVVISEWVSAKVRRAYIEADLRRRLPSGRPGVGAAHAPTARL